MRILITTEQYPPEVSGVGAVAHGFATALAARGHGIFVLATRRGHSEWREEEEGVRVRGVAGASPRILKMLPISGALCSILRSQRPDVVFASAYRPTGLPAAFLARRMAIPVVFYVHGTEFLTERRNPVRRALLRHACRHVKALVANSHNTARLVHEIVGPLKTAVEVIHPGIFVGCFAPVAEPEGSPVILTLSRLARRKGVDLVLRAAAQLRAGEFGDLKVVVGGDGPSREELHALARALGIWDSVEWLGSVPRERVPAVISRSTLFVLASREDPLDLESFGIVYLEAGAVGRAVVGARVGGVSEAVLDGQTGLLVSPDSPDALAKAIGDLLRDPARRCRLGQEGRRRAEEMDWSLQAQRLEAAFEKTLGPHAHSESRRSTRALPQ